MKRTPDLIDAARSQWADLTPDVDTTSMDVIGRVLRAAAVLRRRLDVTIAEAGLNRAEFDLLCALRRGGVAVTPGRLNEITVSSGAATTKRLRELTDRGLLERTADQRDRRSARVRLTAAGEALVDEVFPQVMAAEQALLSGLTARQRESLAGGLADLLRTVEG
ncbi:MarR family transcriptional regulator [Saccharopolyspora sp. NPDC047091]|uniref:MarR family winged helix-turn-helix transcriptional regulator n=1 Tax=Saccharopolyspora sp. NPDC047091 TaxID=3155924 RepID=UPI0033CD80DA